MPASQISCASRRLAESSEERVPTQPGSLPIAPITACVGALPDLNLTLAAMSRRVNSSLLTEESEWADGGRDMISCSNVTQKDTSYCCLGMEGCCNSGVGRFEVLPSKPYVWAQWNKEAGGYVVKTPLSAASSSSSSSASSTSLTASGTSTATSKASSAAGETSASNESKSSSDGTRVPTETGAPGQGGASQPSPATETGQPSGLSTAAQAGIGVGAAAGALLVAAVAYLWWKLRKVQQANQGLKTAQWQDPQDDAYPTQFLAPPYYPQNPQQKYELQATGEAHELQGHHYFVRGDASSAEMTTQHGYAPESPVTSFGHAR